MAKALPSIMPPLSEKECIEVSQVYSASGQLMSNSRLLTTRPFRSPHHTTSKVGLIGGNTVPLPGEISLSHRGVLFLDEFPEFPRHVLESLRQPIEDGVITIARAKGTISYPAKFMLVANSNPCPCGNFGQDSKKCICTPAQINKYQKKISGPLLDRIDMHIYVAKTEINKLEENFSSEPSSEIRKRVVEAKEIQHKRFKDSNILSNSEMSTKDIKKYCKLTDSARLTLKKASENLNISARGYYRIIKVAQTIADLESSIEITNNHILEAVQFRTSSAFGTNSIY